MRHLSCLAGIVLLSACATGSPLGRAPEFNSPRAGQDFTAMMTEGMPRDVLPPAQPSAVAMASLWTGDRESLLGDRRAINRGDILTVVIEIDDSAAISNSTDRSRSGSQEMSFPQLFGLPQRLQGRLPEGATVDPAVDLGSSSDFNGAGSVSRNEQLELRIAATIVDVLPNGVLEIAGTQEVRVNFELRELLVTGYVRPADISRQNEITYDKIASARISYGGRGQISDMQQPRIGQQAVEAVLPF
jgi:flagellar L-ring protein precursor FlgH